MNAQYGGHWYSGDRSRIHRPDIDGQGEEDSKWFLIHHGYRIIQGHIIGLQQPVVVVPEEIIAEHLSSRQIAWRGQARCMEEGRIPRQGYWEHIVERIDLRTMKREFSIGIRDCFCGVEIPVVYPHVEFVQCYRNSPLIQSSVHFVCGGSLCCGGIINEPDGIPRTGPILKGQVEAPSGLGLHREDHQRASEGEENGAEGYDGHGVVQRKDEYIALDAVWAEGAMDFSHNSTRLFLFDELDMVLVVGG